MRHAVLAVIIAVVVLLSLPGSAEDKPHLVASTIIESTPSQASLLVGANECLKTAQDVTSQTFLYGRDYLRIYLDYLYIPYDEKKLSTLLIQTRVYDSKGNELAPSPFQYATDPQPRQTISATRGDLIMPAVALNYKTPVRIEMQLRTKKDLSKLQGIISGAFSAAGNLFTGGAAQTITSLTGKANASKPLFEFVEKLTERSDVNTVTVFDPSTVNEWENSDTALIAVFMGTDGKFMACDRPELATRSPDYKPYTECMIKAILPIQSPEEARAKTPYKFLITQDYNEKYYYNTKTEMYGSEFELADSSEGKYVIIESKDFSSEHSDLSLLPCGECRIMAKMPLRIGQKQHILPIKEVYPDGKEAFLLLRIQKYSPYTDIANSVMLIPDIREYFVAALNLMPASIEDRYEVSANGKNGIKIKRPKKDIWVKVETEAKKLHDKLQILVRTGDLSLTDAHAVMTEFSKQTTDCFKEATNINFNAYIQELASHFPTEDKLKSKSY